MTRFHHGMTVEEQKAFLTDARLRLARDIRRTRWTEGIFSLRHMPTGKHLRVSADGLYILGCFGPGATAAEVMSELMKVRRCPPLRTFYTFIVEACDRDILVTDPAPEFPRASLPRRWPSLPPPVVRWTIVSGGVAAVIAILFQPGPVNGWGLTTGRAAGDALLAFILLSLSASAGSLLASATVLRLGGEVRRPTVSRKTWLPRVSFDWSDSEIGGPAAIGAAALLRLTPTAWLALICVTVPALRPLSLFVNIGLLLRCGPLSDPVRRFLRAHWGNPLKRTVARDWFFVGRAPKLGDRIAGLWEHDSRYAFRLIGVCLVWSVAAFALMGRAAVGSITEPFISLKNMGGLAFWAFVVWSFVAVAGAAWIVLSRRRSSAPKASGPERDVPKGPAPDARALFEAAPLFRTMPPEVVDDLARGCRTLAIPRGANVVGLAEEGEELYVVRIGELEVVSRSEPGDDATVMLLRAGDVFGETELLGDPLRPRNIRAAGPAEVFVVTAPDILQTLMRHLSIPVIEEIVLKRTFFRGLSLLHGCDPRTIGEICRLSRFETVEKDRVIGASGRESRHFSFVFTGLFEARRNDRKKDALPPGTTFGEVSVLVGEGDDEFVARVASRRLVVGRDDFLPLLARDPELALRLEEAAGRRIGRPVFPCRPAS